MLLLFPICTCPVFRCTSSHLECDCSFPRAVPHHAKIFLVALAIYLIGYEKDSGIAGGLGAKKKKTAGHIQEEKLLISEGRYNTFVHVCQLHG